MATTRTKEFSILSQPIDLTPLLTCCTIVPWQRRAYTFCWLRKWNRWNWDSDTRVLTVEPAKQSIEHTDMITALNVRGPRIALLSLWNIPFTILKTYWCLNVVIRANYNHLISSISKDPLSKSIRGLGKTWNGTGSWTRDFGLWANPYSSILTTTSPHWLIFSTFLLLLELPPLCCDGWLSGAFQCMGLCRVCLRIGCVSGHWHILRLHWRKTENSLRVPDGW